MNRKWNSHRARRLQCVAPSPTGPQRLKGRLHLLRLMMLTSLLIATGASSNTSVFAQFFIQDLGDLGGNWSTARDVNNRGEVVGAAALPNGDRHAFYWSQSTGMLDLGTLGGNFSVADAINDVGQVVGYSLTADGEYHSFIWTEPGPLVDLGTLGGPVSRPRDINEAGQVVGQSFLPNGDQHGYFWSQATGMIDIGALGSYTQCYPCRPASVSNAWAINEAGVVVGSSKNDQADSRALIWSQDEGMQDLGTLGGSYSGGFDINDLGEVVGRSRAATGEDFGFIWDAENGMRSIGSLGGYDPYNPGSLWASSAYAINNRSQVAGFAFPPAGGYHAVLWTEAGGIEDLGTLGGDQSSADFVNDAGEVVGLSKTGDGDRHAFVWTREDGMVDLGVLPGKTFSYAVASLPGKTVGYSGFGPDRAVLWSSGQTVFSLCRDVVVTADSSCQASVDPTELDDGSLATMGDPLNLTLQPAGPFTVGDHLVSLTADDGSSSDSCQALISVRDLAPPVISNLTATPEILWAPNHQMETVTISVEALDGCSPPPACRISSVAVNEFAGALGSGNTAPDWQITGNLTLNLRAERSGNGQGRVYTVDIECLDTAANRATAQVVIPVSHDQGQP